MTNKKMTAPIVSVGADTEQSPNVCNDSITDLKEDFNNFNLKGGGRNGRT